MSLSIEIQKEQKLENKRKIKKSSEVFDLEEVQEIKDAIQEHLFLIGLDNKNNIKNISLLGVGTSNKVEIGNKDLLRIALLSGSNKVILVHNHPSGEVEPSKMDKEFTNTIYKFLKIFNIELLDHIIVSENIYKSMAEDELINKDYESYKINLLDNILLSEENEKLKNEVKLLTDKLRQTQNLLESEVEEYE